MFLKKRLETYTQDRKQVYIIPTKAGLKFIFINFTLFLISLSYANNMALLITFIMVSYLIIQMLETHKIILETIIDGVTINDNFLDSQNELLCHFKNKLIHATTKYIQFQIQSKNKDDINSKRLILEDENITKHEIEIKNRGHYEPKRIKAYTFGKSKLFYVWRYFPIDKGFYIYPSRIHNNPPRLKDDTSKASTKTEMEFSEHIPYTHGLNSKRIDWKVYARKDILYWKKHIDYHSIIMDINYNQFEGEKEERLGKMSFLIEKFFKEGASWKLTLPNKILASSHGIAHFKKSLEVISEF